MIIKGANILTEGDRFKYLFGARFDTTVWNKEVDGYLEDYWRRYGSFERLHGHNPASQDYNIILTTLIQKCKVSFWQAVGKEPIKAETWQSRHFEKIEDTQELKRKIRPPIQSSRNRVLQEFSRYKKTYPAADPVPDPGFGRLPLTPGGSLMELDSTVGTFTLHTFGSVSSPTTLSSRSEVQRTRVTPSMMNSLEKKAIYILDGTGSRPSVTKNHDVSAHQEKHLPRSATKADLDAKNRTADYSAGDIMESIDETESRCTVSRLSGPFSSQCAVLSDLSDDDQSREC